MPKQIDPFEHVIDSKHIHIFEQSNITIDNLEFYGFPLKFIILMTICAALVAWALIWLGLKMKNGDPPRGKMWNLVESLLFFVRDKIARPGIGEHDGDTYLPYLTTLFLFIFFMNLIGLLPFLGSPTASIMVTGPLALISFIVIHLSGVREHGVGGYLRTFVPNIHLEGGPLVQVFAVFITIGITIMEIATAFIRAGVLAVRLFANMLAGHTVLFVILFFIALVANPEYKIEIAQDWMIWGVAPASVILVTALSLLELFIAGLQAFVFTYLTSVFIGLAKHAPH